MSLRRALKISFLVFLGCACLPAAAFFFRGPILRQAAMWWVVESPDLHADAILVPGGGMDSRPFSAAELYLQHLAPKVLIPRNPESKLERTGIVLTHADLTRQLLVRSGVPNDAIETIGTNLESSRDELVASLEWARKNRATRILVTTDLFHTRRMHWFGNHLMNPEGVQLLVTPIRTRRYTETNWWTQEEGLIAFQNELVKSAFYRIHHW
jgi:uncharacterized SAM-binding protein YcdF (DUF218 family)